MNIVTTPVTTAFFLSCIAPMKIDDLKDKNPDYRPSTSMIGLINSFGGTATSSVVNINSPNKLAAYFSFEIHFSDRNISSLYLKEG